MCLQPWEVRWLRCKQKLRHNQVSPFGLSPQTRARDLFNSLLKLSEASVQSWLVCVEQSVGGQAEVMPAVVLSVTSSSPTLHLSHWALPSRNKTDDKGSCPNFSTMPSPLIIHQHCLQVSWLMLGRDGGSDREGGIEKLACRCENMFEMKNNSLWFNIRFCERRYKVLVCI